MESSFRTEIRKTGVVGIELPATHKAGKPVPCKTKPAFRGSEMARWVFVLGALFTALLAPVECPAQVGQLSGQVRYGDTGIPYAEIYSATDGGYIFSDAGGNYSLNLTARVHHILVYAPGFQLFEADIAISAGAVTEYDFVLLPQVLVGAIQGTVRDSQSGLPVALATVGVPAQGMTITTGFDGYYWLQVPAGTFDLVVQAPGYVIKTVESVTLLAGQVRLLNVDLIRVGGGDDHCNDPAPCATPLEINGTGRAGSIETAGDVDWFQWQALAGVDYEIKTSDLGPGSDTVLSIYREDGTTLIASDDDSGLGYASKIIWTADHTEMIYLRVNHYSLSGTGTYRVEVRGSDDHCNEPGPCATELLRNGNAISGRTDVAGDLDWFRFSATSGLTFEVETLQLGPDSDTVISLYRSDGTSLIVEDDDGGEGAASRIIWVADTRETIYVMVRQYSPDARGSYRIQLKAYDDHCDTPGSCATFLSPYGTKVEGEFEIDEDQDWFRFQALPGVAYVIETSNLSEDPPCDTCIYLVAPDGQTLLGFNDDSGSLASRIEWLAGTGGVFYVLVKHYSPQGRGTYNISLTGSDDHGDVPAWASELATYGDPLPGRLDTAYDFDWFYFLAEAGRTYTIETFNLGEGCDTYLKLYDQSLYLLAAHDDIAYPENLASRIDYTFSETDLYGVAVFSASGAGGLGTYEIRIVAEDDYPNSPTGDSPLLTTDGTEVSGQFESAGDEDWFRFEVEAGRKYVVETLNLSAGCDTVMEIYESDGTTLLAYDDDGGGGLASRLEGLITSTRTLFIRLRHYNSLGKGGYGIRIVALAPDDHADIASAGTLINADGAPVSGQIGAGGDVDWFQFEAQEGVAYVIETSCMDGTCDTIMELYATDGLTLIGSDDDGGEGLSSRIRWSGGEAGTYFVAVRHFCPEETGAYQISIRQEDTTCIPILAGQTVNGNLFQEGEGDLYCLPVSGGTRISVVLHGPAFGADFDLYMKWDGPPSLSEYEARGFSSISNEQCGLTITSSGTLYIWVRSYASGGDYTLLVQESPYQPACDFTLVEGVPHTGSLSGPGDGKLYCLEVQEGDQVLIILDGQTTGSDFDLYLKHGAPPTLADYDTRAYTAFADETAALQNLPAGTLYVWVVSYSGSGQYVLEAHISSTQAGCVNLEDGVPRADQLYFTYDEQLYCFDVESGDQIAVNLSGPEIGADFDLFLKFGAPPALDDWDASARSSISYEQVQFTATSNGTVYVTVWSYAGSGAYTIQASKASRQSLGLATKLSQSPGQEVLFMKGSIKDGATGEPLQPSSFCITIKNVGKFCYQPGSGGASQISFVPGGYFFLVLPQAQNPITCVLSDVPCYNALEKNFTTQQISDAVFDISLDPGSDCDGDGMTCEWEKRYGLNIWKNDAFLDLDQDTYTNLEEYNAGTNPNEKNSVPLALKSVVQGDINGDGNVTLADAIMASQAAVGLHPAGVRLGSEVNGDGKVGMAEVVFILQKASGLR